MFEFVDRYRLKILAQVGIAGLAILLLFCGLTDKYLWQDEAETAVLATRMLKFGKPLAYDGVNLIGTDRFDADEYAVGRQAADWKDGLDYHLRRKEFKPDTAWKWQPWGLFAVTAVSIKALGPTTLAARLPFALAGVATALLLFHLVRKYSGSFQMALLASLFLLCNPYWILHARQCRYYSLSSLLLVLTLLSYARWQESGKGGTVAFVAAAWCYFQIDYGAVWPVLAVLFLDAFLTRKHSWRHTSTVCAVLAVTIAPFLYYYELWGRGVGQNTSWKQRFLANLFNMNEYVVPVLVVLASAALLAWHWKSLAPAERRLVVVSEGIILALALWVPTVSVVAFLRYAIIAAPLGCLLTAWTVVRVFGSRRVWLIWPCAALLIVTPWASLPLHALVSPSYAYALNPWYRAEFSALRNEDFSHQQDPNRLVIDWLKKNAAPSDEILINYEDKPMMFYLPNPIRGGVSAFRVADDSRMPPRFVVLRLSVGFVNWPIFLSEVRRYRWTQVPVQAPDLPWGNNPDPMSQYEIRSQRPVLFFAQRVGP